MCQRNSAWTAQRPGGKGDILECVIIAAKQDLVYQDPKRSIRSLKINAKENMKVLKEAVEPRKKSLSSPLPDHHLLSALTIVLFSSAAASAVSLLPRYPALPFEEVRPPKPRHFLSNHAYLEAQLWTCPRRQADNSTC
jgi:hypothetical protein